MDKILGCIVTASHCLFAPFYYEGNGVRGKVSINRSDEPLLPPPLPVESGDTSLLVQGDDRLGGLNVSISLKRLAFAFSFSYSNRAWLIAYTHSSRPSLGQLKTRVNWQDRSVLLLIDFLTCRILNRYG